jgi:predicted Zn-dependent protease
MKQAASYLRAFTKENISYSCINEKYKSIIEKDINFALILSKQIVRHGTSEESINVINRISEHTISTSDMICDLGDAYSFAGNYNKAQQAYTDAYYMVPGKITPLIKLFNLQRENNDISRAKLTAERILNNRYKVTGSLVVRSKNQAKHFINNLNYSNL